MSGVRSLRIKLSGIEVGSLFGIDDGRAYFVFDEAYATNSARPILSTSFIADTEPETVAQLLDPTLASLAGPGAGRLPPFFSNLLPEGMLRKHLIQHGNLAENDELGLLALCGEDLPGDVSALAEQLDERSLGRLLTQNQDSYEMSSHQLPTPQAESLSGVQPKVSLIRNPDGRYVMRSKNDIGLHFIGKLPAGDFAKMPELESLSLSLARAAGVHVCTTELLPLTSIANQLPFSLRDDASNFLLVHRFDRDVQTATGRLHMEDFAQALETRPENKYDGNYAAIGLVLARASIQPEEDLLELLRRIKVNELLGNYDAHLKNFSILYGPTGEARLSPAYDIVAHSAYLGGRGHAMYFYPNQGRRQQLTPVALRQLSNYWGVTENKLRNVVIGTVDAAMRTWPAIIRDSLIDESQKERLRQHINENQSAIAWTRRNEKLPK